VLITSIFEEKKNRSNDLNLSCFSTWDTDFYQTWKLPNLNMLVVLLMN